ncbi:MAG TPA: hypothetical protein VFE24_00830 [Pirellulales bacterium]|jgi:hypothetical protein|nr:hypothetical protein [Pirellulales bacterium]
MAKRSAAARSNDQRPPSASSGKSTAAPLDSLTAAPAELDRLPADTNGKRRSGKAAEQAGNHAAPLGSPTAPRAEPVAAEETCDIIAPISAFAYGHVAVDAAAVPSFESFDQWSAWLVCASGNLFMVLQTYSQSPNRFTRSARVRDFRRRLAWLVDFVERSAAVKGVWLAAELCLLGDHILRLPVGHIAVCSALRSPPGANLSWHAWAYDLVANVILELKQALAEIDQECSTEPATIADQEWSQEVWKAVVAAYERHAPEMIEHMVNDDFIRKLAAERSIFRSGKQAGKAISPEAEAVKVPPAAGVPATRRNEERDRYLYDRAMEGVVYPEILIDANRRFKHLKLENVQSVRAAIKRFEEHHPELPKIPNRRSVRH